MPLPDHGFDILPASTSSTQIVEEQNQAGSDPRGLGHAGKRLCREPFVALVAVFCLLALRIGHAETAPPAAKPRFITLQECIDLALSRNLDLQIQHLSTDIAQFNLDGSYGAYVPNFSVELDRNLLDQPGDIDPKKSGGDFPYNLETDTLGSSLNGRLPLGLSYSFGGIDSYLDASTDTRTDPNTAAKFPGGIRVTNEYSANMGVSVRQHLLKDFWIDSYWENLLIRRKDLKISREALRFQTMTTVLAVELGYDDLMAARERITVRENALGLSRAFLAETRRRVEVGDLPPLDAEQAETQLENNLTALVAAQESFTNTQNALKLLITDNFMDWVDTDLQPKERLVAIKADLDRQRSFKSAMKDRPDLIEARLAVERNDVTVKYRQNQLFPSLDFVGAYAGLGIQPDSSSTLSQAFGFHSPEYSYGMVLSFPLSNVAQRNSYRASKAARQIAELQLKKAEQQILAQVADFINEIASRYAQVDSTRQARIYAHDALAAEEKKLANGLTTAFVVLQLQQILISAQAAEVDALAGYNKALAQLAFAEGSTLDRHRLKLRVE